MMNYSSQLSSVWDGLLEPNMFVTYCSAHLHSLRFLHLETTTLLQPHQDGASQSGRITYDRVVIEIQASHIRTHTCTQWCPFCAKIQIVFSEVSGKSHVRYLTLAIINAICRDLSRCLSELESTPGFSPFEHILKESQADTLIARVTSVFFKAVGN